MKNSEKDIASVFGKHAQAYAENYFSVERYSEPIRWFQDQITENAQLLDVACGPGNLSFHLLKSKPNLQITGTDIAPEMLEIAQQKIPQGRFELRSCADLLSLKQKFEGVLCGFVLPYLTKSEVEKLIKDVRLLLEPSGCFLLSGNMGAYENSETRTASTGEGPALSNFLYPLEFMQGLLQENGFKQIKPFTYHVDYGDFQADEFVLVSKL